MANINFKTKNLASKLLLATALMTGSVSLTACSSTTQFFSDSSLTASVKKELAVNHNTHASDIHVDTNGSIVTLSGVVKTEKERIAANIVANKVKGVKRVNNALKLPHEVKH